MKANRWRESILSILLTFSAQNSRFNSFIEPIQRHPYKSSDKYKDCFAFDNECLNICGVWTKGSCLTRSQRRPGKWLIVDIGLVWYTFACSAARIHYHLYKGVDGKSILDLFLCVHYVLFGRGEFGKGKRFHTLFPRPFQEVLVMSRTKVSEKGEKITMSAKKITTYIINFEKEQTQGD